MSVTFYSRLEPQTRGDDLLTGVAAAVYDPAWMLARQWQLGELVGADAGSPIRVRYTADVLRVRTLSAGGPVRDVSDGGLPWEAAVAAAPVRTGPAWTLRLRIDTGRELLAQLRAHGLQDRAAAVLEAFPVEPAVPTESGPDPADPAAGLAAAAAGRVPDGAAAYRHWSPGLRAVPPVVASAGSVPVDDALRDALLDWLGFCDQTVAEPVGGAWDSARFRYRAALSAPGPNATVQLSAADHCGGPLDWWAFDVTSEPGDPGVPAETVDLHLLPSRVQFAGMPTPRWWEFEESNVDYGQVEANPADLARMALLEFAFEYGNDHFAIPVRLPVGSLCRTTALLVTDTFGLTIRVAPAATSSTWRTARGSQHWTMFTLTEADAPSEWFCLPNVSADLTSSRPIEEILLARDEMANLVWAIEGTVEGPEGRPTDRRREQAAPAVPTPAGDGQSPRWLLGTPIPAFWYPLVVDPADPTILVVQMLGTAATPPRGTLLGVGSRVAVDAVPREGTRLRRDYVSTRGPDGRTVAWSRRRSVLGRGEGSAGLRFDTVREAPL